jgi:hypothetical protein
LSFNIICYDREREFKVAIKFASSVKMQQLKELLSGKKVDTPQEALTVFDIVLKEVAAQRYIFSIILHLFLLHNYYKLSPFEPLLILISLVVSCHLMFHL